MTAADVFLGFLALLFPPLPVWVKCGVCSADSLINILLCVLGYIPGLLHAWYIIAKYPEPPYEYEPLHGDRDSSRVAHVYVAVPPPQHQQPQRGGNSKTASNNVNYGTQGASAGSSAQQQHPQQQHGVTNAGEGSSQHQGVPPSYAEVVAGDNKVQSHD